MPLATEITSAYQKQYEQFIGRLRDHEPSYLLQRRDSAFSAWLLSRFFESKSEAWKYTAPQNLIKSEYLNNLTNPHPSPLHRCLDTSDIGNMPTAKIYIHNGSYNPAKSNIDSLNNCAQVTYLQDLSRNSLKKVLSDFRHLQRQDGFMLLNEALNQNTLMIRVFSAVDLPVIHLIYTASIIGANYPRLYFIVEPNINVTVIEHFGCLFHEYDSLCDAVSCFLLQPKSELTHVRLIREGDLRPVDYRTHHVSQSEFVLQESARLAAHIISLSGKIVRHETKVNLTQPHATASIKGLMMANDQQHTDHRVVINHLAPESYSECDYRGLANGNGTGIFNGRVQLDKSAQRTESQLMTHNLLLSENAHFYTKPELEIYANNVLCKHGATIGKIDDAIILYMQSRGLNKDAAIHLLIAGFAENVLRGLPVALADWLTPILHAAIANCLASYQVKSGRSSYD